MNIHIYECMLLLYKDIYNIILIVNYIWFFAGQFMGNRNILVQIWKIYTWLTFPFLKIFIMQLTNPINHVISNRLQQPDKLYK